MPESYESDLTKFKTFRTVFNGTRLSIIPDPETLAGAPQSSGCTSCAATGQGQGTKAIKILAVALLLLWAFSAFKK